MPTYTLEDLCQSEQLVGEGEFYHVFHYWEFQESKACLKKVLKFEIDNSAPKPSLIRIWQLRCSSNILTLVKSISRSTKREEEDKNNDTLQRRFRKMETGLFNRKMGL